MLRPSSSRWTSSTTCAMSPTPPSTSARPRPRLAGDHDHLRASNAEYPDPTPAEVAAALRLRASPVTVWRAFKALGLTVKKNAPRLRTRPPGREGRPPNVVRPGRRRHARAPDLPRRNLVLHSDGPTLRVRAGGRPGARRRPLPPVDPGQPVVAQDPCGPGDAEPGRPRGPYLPAYSPDRNPIEPAFSKLERLARTAAERSVEGLKKLVRSMARKVGPAECRNYILHSGYPAP